LATRFFTCGEPCAVCDPEVPGTDDTLTPHTLVRGHRNPSKKFLFRPVPHTVTQGPATVYEVSTFF